MKTLESPKISHHRCLDHCPWRIVAAKNHPAGDLSPDGFIYHPDNYFCLLDQHWITSIVCLGTDAQAAFLSIIVPGIGLCPMGGIHPTRYTSIL